MRLARVLSNLLTNAVRYSPDGGDVTVFVSRHGDAGEPGSYAALRVQDNGLGIPSADLPHIFERYYRARNVVGRMPGSGIGLAGARQIVEAHGGTLTVKSEEGAGTQVTLRLPLE
jgi:signal transduction histidine kinase